jgi:hypothetical protein
VIGALGSDGVSNQGNQRAILNFLKQAVAALEAGDVQEAVDKLVQAIGRTDGCVLRGSPDGKGPGRDWVLDCNAQGEVYDALVAALEVLQ